MNTQAIAAVLVCGLAAAGAAGQTTVPTAPATAPASAPAEGGMLTVRAVQGTRGAAPPVGDAVSVELYHQGQAAGRFEGRLDESGRAVFAGLPLRRPVQPRVIVEHAGVSYEAVGRPLDALHPMQELAVKVFETTDEPPAWTVQMRHVILVPRPEGLGVIEMLAVNQPADRTWLGRADPDGSKVSMMLDLPAGAAQVQPSGAFHPCCTQVQDGRVVLAAAMKPGTSLYRLRYVLPTTDGRANVRLTAPAPVRMMMVFVREGGGVTLEAPGLTKGDVFDIRGQPMRCYTGADIPAGGTVAFTVGNLPKMQPPRPAEEGSNLPQILAVGGGVLLVGLCVLVLLLKPARKAAGSKAAGPGPAE